MASYKVKDIKHENGNHWVLHIDGTYTVMRNVGTHSVSLQAFKADSDGLSNAIAYCDFLEKRRNGCISRGRILND